MIDCNAKWGNNFIPIIIIIIITTQVKKPHTEWNNRLKKVDFIHYILFFAILESLKLHKPLKYLAEKH